MKKVFAALAASAVAVSMLAFAGCGDSQEGAIKGNYTEKTPEELEEIIDGIDADKVFSEDISGLGFKVNLSGEASMGKDLSASGSVKAEYKLSVNESGIAGYGEATVKFNYKGLSVDDNPVAVTYSGDIKGTLYNDSQYAYGSLNGKLNGKDLTEDDSAMKAKINFMELIGGVNDDNYSNVSASLVEEAASGLDIATLLQMADQVGVKVTVDDKDGVKFKLSASEDTVWAIVMLASDGALGEEGLAGIKEMVTFNKFQLDAYLSLDKDGVFSAASVVCDIDVKIAKELFELDADLTANLKGSVELYAHSDSVSLPSGLASDASYFDATDLLLDLIADM